jgi:uncharacterized repeat protein (TIGR03987 family)
MKIILVVGSAIVTMALISYTVGIISEQRTRILKWKVLIFLALGLLFDISGTGCMIIGSSNSPFTIHGIIGYSALLGMLIDNILLWKLTNSTRIGAPVTKSIHIYSRIAYIWWLAVYLSGFLRSMHR